MHGLAAADAVNHATNLEEGNQIAPRDIEPHNIPSRNGSITKLPESADEPNGAKQRFATNTEDQAREVQQFNIAADINPMYEVEKQQEKLSIFKAHLPLGKLFFLGFLA